MKDLKDSLINQKIAEKLREKRGGLRLSLEDIADLSGVPFSTVRRVLYPKQDIAASHLTAIAGALGLNAADVFRQALDEVGLDLALADVHEILEARKAAGAAKPLSAAEARVTKLHPRDMSAEELEALITRRAAYDDPEADTMEPDAP